MRHDGTQLVPADAVRQDADEEFKAIPSSAGGKFLDILPIEADSTHPRGVFHNQFFSSLAGATFVDTFTLAGARLSVPSDGKVVMSKGSCGDPGSFSFEGAVAGKLFDDSPSQGSRQPGSVCPSAGRARVHPCCKANAGGHLVPLASLQI